jgi:hypothetical protein
MTRQLRSGRGLSNEILAAVTASPGITTNVLCREVRVRKSDVLAELEALRREQLLRFENACRGSKCWYLVGGRGNQFPTCSRGMPEATFGTEGAASRSNAEIEGW